MNKTHLTAKAGSRALSPIAVAGIRQSFPELAQLDDAPENPWMGAEADDEASDWPEMEKDAAYAGSGYSGADDMLAADVETEINLLLHGVSYR